MLGAMSESSEAKNQDRGLERLLSTIAIDAETNKAKGDQGERLFKWFLENDPVYKSKLRKVWLWRNWPGRNHGDRGIDLVAETYEGDLWAIQSKCYAETTSITKEDMNTFLTESNNGRYVFRLLLGTTDRLAVAARETCAEQTVPVGYLLRADLREAHVEW